MPQHRQIHAGGHPRVPQQPARNAHRRRAVGDHGVDVLPDRADGRRWRAREDADRNRLRGVRRRRRRADAGLRAVRRHGRHDVGPDHQGDPARRGVDPPRDVRMDALRIQLPGVPDRGRGRSEGAGAGRCAARRRGANDDAHRARPALPRAGVVLQGTHRPDLARHGARVRHRGPAAYPDALLHRPDGEGSAQIGDLGDGHHRRLLRAHDLPRDGRGDQRGLEQYTGRGRGGQHGGAAARAVRRRRRGLAARQPVPRVRRRGGVRDDRRGRSRPRARGGFRDGARPLRRRHPGRARHAAGTGQGRPRRHGVRRRAGHHHRHRGERAERRTSSRSPSPSPPPRTSPACCSRSIGAAATPAASCSA